ncbi:hypothetical protein [Pseudarthrobacter sp. SSS035]|uniref:hypothetical protein n=1 Tax=Pseudarthrobacter sp. SSS035 TaxID=2931399 RepID=UPI00201074C6|nr:hypothetical protein [Pseudarthrobacter sp. SSS035]
MSERHDQEQILRVSSEGKESVEIQLESSNPVTVRLQLVSGCTCHHPTQNRPGSYVDSDFGIR